MKSVIKRLESFTMNIDRKLKEGIMKITSEFKHSNLMQESCTDIMRFLIQDLLDYAQIKAGNFT